MRARHAQEKGIEWRWADVRDMKEIPSDSVDVAFDKGTLDAMIHGSPWSPPDQVLSDTSRYMREVGRVLYIFLFLLPKVLLFCDVTVGPPRSQARRDLLVRHVPATAFYKTTVAGWGGGVVGSGDEDSGRWRELLRLLCFHPQEEVKYMGGSAYLIYPLQLTAML
jgi:hypothetical protein